MRVEIYSAADIKAEDVVVQRDVVAGGNGGGKQRGETTSEVGLRSCKGKQGSDQLVDGSRIQAEHLRRFKHPIKGKKKEKRRKMKQMISYFGGERSKAVKAPYTNKPA